MGQLLHFKRGLRGEITTMLNSITHVLTIIQSKEQILLERKIRPSMKEKEFFRCEIVTVHNFVHLRLV